MRGTTAQVRRSIVRLVEHWRPILGLDTWVIEVRFDERSDRGNCVACTQYEEAVVAFNPRRILKEVRNLAGLQELVVHELVHCLAWRSNERTVTHLSRAFLRAAGMKYE